ncbi:MAG: LysM peptidoglycan-binding domain-containing protein [Gammaproteobacteria bacterium]|nr:LysM peptidoglycan-binding domain-containing protein [Gammaproteobacteria bacterium]
MIKIFARLAFALFCLSAVAQADVIELNPDHPERYVVVKGDTLWDITGRFLRDPWLWPKVWKINPQVDNPHLIYPGDVIVLRWGPDGPMLMVEGSGPEGPRIREKGLDDAIPIIPLNAIQQFLNHAMVLNDPDIANYAYVLQGADEHIVTGAGDKVYVRNIDQAIRDYNIYRYGGPYIDPESGETLGYEALHIGSGQIVRKGDPATLFAEKTNREVMAADVLLPRDESPVLPYYTPMAPEVEIDARIIRGIDRLSQIGTLDIVVLNKGQRDGLEINHVLVVDQKGQPSKDIVTGEWVGLPNERAGVVMVFRSFERVSFALVLSSTRSIHLGDIARTP